MLHGVFIFYGFCCRCCFGWLVGWLVGLLRFLLRYFLTGGRVKIIVHKMGNTFSISLLTYRTCNYNYRSVPIICCCFFNSFPKYHADPINRSQIRSNVLCRSSSSSSQTVQQNYMFKCFFFLVPNMKLKEAQSARSVSYYLSYATQVFVVVLVLRIFESKN